jgi:osmotically-inducible protein OsmY
MIARVRNDEFIAKEVFDSMYWDSRVDASKVSVKVDNGIVTLSGTVPSYSSRAAASEDAWLITGVRDVENQLKVDFRTTVPSDEEIASNIQDQFRWDNDLYPYDIQVTVLTGWVTLEGTVDAFWKKVRAEDLAFSMRGVLGLTNKIAVVPTQTVTDENLAEDIINALDRNVNVNVDDINVTVEEGTVTLTGAVPSWSSKRAAYDSARYTLGVKEVKDQITVTLPEETFEG